MENNGGKNNINYTQLHTKSIGVERRVDLALEEYFKQGYIPKTIEYRDIDRTFQEWVENKLHIVYNGNKIPVHFLLTIQRLANFGKTWNMQDTEGGLLLNFITVSREITPKKGTIYDKASLPPTEWFLAGQIPVIENGFETVDRVMMKEPTQVDLIYTVSIFSTKLAVVNGFNILVQEQFKGIESYLNVNGHFISSELNDVTDESKYDLDNRRFYSQSYKILVKAYIIREDYFRIERVQTRTLIAVSEFAKERPLVTIEESESKRNPINLSIVFQKGKRPFSKFKMDSDLLIKEIKSENIISFVLKRDGEEVITTNPFTLHTDERITINARCIDTAKDALIKLIGVSPE
jgi:CBS domain-containing protein